MDDIYAKYYLKDEAVFNIMNRGLVVFDTSALLDLYCYSEITQKYIFDTIFSDYCINLYAKLKTSIFGFVSRAFWSSRFSG